MRSGLGFLARRTDRGAVTAITAGLFGVGVLLGFGAVVIDVGQLYVERGELQNGADAAAMSVARTCAANPATCAGQAAQAELMANSNARDGRARVTEICGTGQGLPACTPPPANLTACFGSPTGTYVEVRTATETKEGETFVPNAFVKAIAGSSGYTGTTVAACARAAWGAPSGVNGVAVTMSYCAWNQLTANGTRLAQPPPAVPPVTVEGAIYLHGTRIEDSCAPGNSGWQAPGGFSWLDETGPCRSLVSTGGTFGGATGVAASGSCQTLLANARATRQVLWMPVFDGVRNTGSNIEYSLRGVSAFVVTGYRLSGFNAPSTLSGRMLCSGNERCLYGYFTTGLIESTGGLDESIPGYGVRAVVLSG